LICTGKKEWPHRGKVSGAVRSMEGFDRVAVKLNFGAVWCEVDDKCGG
jgi:hypothetical protein